MAIAGMNHIFDVVQDHGATEHSRNLTIETDAGEVHFFAPKRHTSLFNVKTHDGRTAWKISVPEWLAIKAGLINY